MRTIRRILAATVIIGAAVLVGPASALAAPPDPPCEWSPGGFGTASTCDGMRILGQDLRFACGDPLTSNPFGYVPIRGPGGMVLAQIALNYQRGGDGRICRLAYAFITATPDTGASCYALVRRNSDGQAYYTYDGNGVVSAPVYDANVTSHVWGRCRYNGVNYDARTPSY